MYASATLSAGTLLNFILFLNCCLWGICHWPIFRRSEEIMVYSLPGGRERVRQICGEVLDGVVFLQLLVAMIVYKGCLCSVI
jgi:hypothetical protein